MRPLSLLRLMEEDARLRTRASDGDGPQHTKT